VDPLLPLRQLAATKNNRMELMIEAPREQRAR
jgi:hypothetical protein